MALDSRKMTKEISTSLLRGKDIDKETRKSMEESWYKICDAIVKHIQKNSEIQINFPSIPNHVISEINEEGLPENINYYNYIGSLQ